MRRFRAPRASFITASLLVGILASLLCHYFVDRRYRSRPDVSFGTIYLNRLLKPHSDDSYLMFPDDYETNPAMKRFCDRLIERAQPHLSNLGPTVAVWAVQTGSPRGWPLISDDRYALFGVEGKGTNGGYAYLEGWVDSQGESSTDFLALVGNTLIHAMVAWLFVASSARFFNSIRARQRTRDGLCRFCGYDLRGNTGPRCSECGSERPMGEQQQVDAGH